MISLRFSDRLPLGCRGILRDLSYYKQYRRKPLLIDKLVSLQRQKTLQIPTRKTVYRYRNTQLSLWRTPCGVYAIKFKQNLKRRFIKLKFKRLNTNLRCIQLNPHKLINLRGLLLSRVQWTRYCHINLIDSTCRYTNVLIGWSAFRFRGKFIKGCIVYKFGFRTWRRDCSIREAIVNFEEYLYSYITMYLRLSGVLGTKQIHVFVVVTLSSSLVGSTSKTSNLLPILTRLVGEFRLTPPVNKNTSLERYLLMGNPL